MLYLRADGSYTWSTADGETSRRLTSSEGKAYIRGVFAQDRANGRQGATEELENRCLARTKEGFIIS